MTPRHFSRFLTASCFALMITGSAAAQATKPFAPYTGQPGKDVVWVPTAQALVDRMLDMAKVTPKDYLVDLGSGDGRTVITAAKRGVRAMGVEFNPDMVALSRRNAAAAGVSDKASFVQGDIFKTDFSKADVVTLFLLDSLNLRLRPTLLAMKPGTRVVSNTFDMGEWEPDEIASTTSECSSFCHASFWIVPARVAGAWQMQQNELTLSQNFQMLSGTLNAAPISNARMRGTEITFTAGGKTFNGRVAGKRMEGTASDGSKWIATQR